MPRLNLRQLQSQIQVIYDAVPEPDGWTALIEHLTDDLNFRSGLIGVEGLDGSGIITRYSVGYTEAENQALKEHFHSVDVWTQALRQNALGRVWSSDYLVPLRQLKKTEFYNDFCIEADMSHSTGAFIKTDKQLALKIAFQHRHEQGEIADKEGHLQYLLPHLSQAAELKQTLNDFQCRLDSTTAIIDSFPIAAVLLDENANVYYANRFAEALFQAHTGVLVRQNQLCLRDERCQQQFRKILRRVIAESQGSLTAETGSACLITESDQGNELEIQVQAISSFSLSNDPGNRQSFALIHFKEININKAYNWEAMQALFKLSSREYKLACDLVQGKSLKEIAQEKHRSINTLKSQLRSLFNKTGTNSQSQLVARLLSSLATLKL